MLLFDCSSIGGQEEKEEEMKAGEDLRVVSAFK